MRSPNAVHILEILPYGAAPTTDAATIYVDIQPSTTDIAQYVEADTIYVDIQASGVDEYVPPFTDYLDADTVYLTVTPSTADVADFVDAAEAYIDIDVSGVDIKEMYDADTIYIDISNMGGECFSQFSSEYLGEGEATLEWSESFFGLEWSADENLEWSYGAVSVEGIGC